MRSRLGSGRGALSSGDGRPRRRRVRALVVVVVAFAGLVGLGWLERAPCVIPLPSWVTLI